MISAARIKSIRAEGGFRFFGRGEYASDQRRIHRSARYEPGVFLRIHLSADVVQRQHSGVYFDVGQVVATLECVGAQNAQAARQRDAVERNDVREGFRPDRGDSLRQSDSRNIAAVEGARPNRLQRARKRDAV